MACGVLPDAGADGVAVLGRRREVLERAERCAPVTEDDRPEVGREFVEGVVGVVLRKRIGRRTEQRDERELAVVVPAEDGQRRVLLVAQVEVAARVLADDRERDDLAVARAECCLLVR